MPLIAFRLSIIPLAPAIFLCTKLHWLRDVLELNAAAIYQLGIGKASGLFLFGGWNDWDPAHVVEQTRWRVLRNVTVANMPQLALSAAYYLWSNHLTVMLAAHEYNTYAAPTMNGNSTMQPEKKRSLRVTNPKSGTNQKSTPFLTIPFHYWASNSFLWTLLHWLASQAVFFARVDMFNHWQRISPFSVSQVGYSIMGIICFFVVSFLIFGYAVWIGVSKLDNRMPLAATCSGALSAACHPGDPSLRHYEKKVYWGIEVADNEDNEGNDIDGEKVLRCTFTSLDAYYPYSDRLYA